MQLSTKHGFAFLCTPKCASTSIEAAIRSHCDITYRGAPALKHINVRRFRRFILPHLRKAAPHAKIETFCLMREPLEWAYSWYRYRSRHLLKNPDHPLHYRYTGNITFEQFLELTFSDDESTSAGVGKQSAFFVLRDGSVGVDRVFHMADLHLVSQYLSAKVGKTIEIPHRNASPNRAPLALSADLESRFRKHFADDYRLYDLISRAGGVLVTAQKPRSGLKRLYKGLVRKFGWRG